MSIHSYAAPSANHVPEYQLSGVPYCLKGEVQDIDNGTTLNVGGQKVYVIEFPRVTRWLYIKSAAAINIYFSKNDAGPNLGKKSMTLAVGGESPRLEWRLNKLYIHNDHRAVDLTIWAGLTNVQGSSFEGQVEGFIDNNSKIG